MGTVTLTFSRRYQVPPVTRAAARAACVPVEIFRESAAPPRVRRGAPTLRAPARERGEVCPRAARRRVADARAGPERVR